MLYAKGSSWGRIVVYLYLDTNGIFGLPLAVTASIVVAYIFFGQALYAVGGDKFLTDVALVAMGRYRGGPPRWRSCPPASTARSRAARWPTSSSTARITIPMMKRSGYPPHLAAAIEAVASNGGQIMPPVMGAAAFLIAEYLAIPYGEVALAAAIPACLYYLALFVQVDLEAAKLGLAGLPRARHPALRGIMRRGWVFLVPLGVLIYTLMLASWEAGKAGMLAMVSTFAVGALQKETRPDAGAGILDAVEATGPHDARPGRHHDAGRHRHRRAPALRLHLQAADAADDHGRRQRARCCSSSPRSSASSSACRCRRRWSTSRWPCSWARRWPSSGIVPLAAHLFLFYFGMLSLITPPDCLATYAAAAIAKSDFWQTGWTGMRLGIVAYVVPFVFVFHPALILRRHARARSRSPSSPPRSASSCSASAAPATCSARSAGAGARGRSRPGSAS